ncbi:unnamed protein product [Allacma fusca]|uniref:EF-hand domain-containing protein n=1 Tax=Allacma fusca TaxID=39272 RepID=A0A8J2LJV8_9HEXA|nr:unnamed protein product [Allacma fusca]
MGQCVCTGKPGNPRRRHKLRKLVLEDLLKITKFNEDEIYEWYEAFLQAVPCGKMTYSIYQELVLKAVFRRGPENAEASGAKLMHHLDLSFRQYDVNGDQTISFREFMVGMSISTKGTLAEKITWAFSLYDIDKDGLITFEEMHEILMLVEKAYGNARSKKEMEKFVHCIFNFLDADHNGVISVQEFLAGLKSKPEIFEFFTGTSDVLTAFHICDLKSKS